MIYVTKQDLIDQAFERLIDESSTDAPNILDNIELSNIELVKSYLATRYNVAVIFDDANPVRDELIVRILVKLMLFDVVRRNAARKVPTDYREDYDHAMEMLLKLSTGKLTLSNVPKAIDENGGEVSNAIWGNNKNTNFYI